jgi:hypothetical protein
MIRSRTWRASWHITSTLRVVVLFLSAGAIAGTNQAWGDDAAAKKVSVLTYHNDIGRTGGNDREEILTPVAVQGIKEDGSPNFGFLWSVAVDGAVYAQPLVLKGVPIKEEGKEQAETVELVIVATEHNSLYAFKAAANAAPSKPIWHWDGSCEHKMKPVPSIRWTEGKQNLLDSLDIVPEVGITGTPVIDETTHRVYFVAKAYHKEREDGDQYAHWLCCVDAWTGKDVVKPREIWATYPGTGTGLDHDEKDDEKHRSYARDAGYYSLKLGTHDGQGMLKFLPKVQNQRAGLLLSKGVVYVAWSSHGDIGAFHGWLIGFDAASLDPVAVLNTSPSGFGASIWQAGAAPAADSEGHIYLTTGNGSFTARGPLFDEATDWGNCVLKLSPRGQRFLMTPPTNAADQSAAVRDGPKHVRMLRVLDYFSPYDRDCLNGKDLDLGSGGVLLPPERVHDAASSDPLLLVAAGKGGTLYVLDRERLGQQALSRSDNVFRRFPNAVGEKYGMGAYFNDSLYYGGGRKQIPPGGKSPEDDDDPDRVEPGYVETPIRILSIAEVLDKPRARFDPRYTRVPGGQSLTFPDKGTTPSVSSNGGRDAILWALWAPWWMEAKEIEFQTGADPEAQKKRVPRARVGHNAPEARLYAFNATSLELLWKSDPVGPGKQALGDRIKFAVSTIANGRVYIGTGISPDGRSPGTLTVFGLR